MKRLIATFALLLVVSVLARAQGPGAFLSVPAPGLRVVVDTLPPVLSPVDSLPIPARAVRLAIFPGTPGAWSVPLLAETLAAAPGELVVRDPSGLVIRRVSSEPFGAAVYAGDSLLGTTPLLVSSRLGRTVLRFTHEGSAEMLAPLGDGDLHVVLDALPGLPGESGAVATPGMTRVYLSAGTGILAGAAAAYLKIKADSRYADYRRSGSAADLDEVRRLDRLSGLALGVSELALFVLTIELFSR